MVSNSNRLKDYVHTPYSSMKLSILIDTSIIFCPSAIFINLFPPHAQRVKKLGAIGAHIGRYASLSKWT